MRKEAVNRETYPECVCALILIADPEESAEAQLRADCLVCEKGVYYDVWETGGFLYRAVSAESLLEIMFGDFGNNRVWTPSKVARGLEFRNALRSKLRSGKFPIGAVCEQPWRRGRKSVILKIKRIM